jgi:LPXTG-site transpeptidase (sortase) family protein
MLARARDQAGQDASDLDLRQMSGRCSEVTVDGMQERSPVRAAIRAIGFACLMAASGLAGYTGWLLWGTGLETARAQDQLRSELGPLIEHPTPPDEERYLPGEAYAALVIPSIEIDFVVVEGPDADYRSYDWTTTLKKGPAHYPDSADPWDGTGRVGIAGHRTTYQHPFLNLEQVRVGDMIELITRHGTYTYEVDRNFVVPEAGSGAALEQTRRPTLVLTTCHPKYSSRERLIVTATLVEQPVSA